jgi:5'-methylthioadenosine phosphorylase
VLHQLGVTGVLAPFAAGSLRAGLEPGDLVVCDQLVDRTSGRADTYVDGPPVHHAPFSDPYDEKLRGALLESARRAGATVHDGGTVVVIQGPRFSTRAESQWYRAQGWDVITMTQYPEAVLARELGLPYAGIALITDRDAGLDGGPPVVEEDVYAVLDQHIGLLRTVVLTAAAHARR